MMREARIDLGAIAANVEHMRSRIGASQLMAVVKANAYGHGAAAAARAALTGGASWLGVADLDEAHELRASGIESPILAWLHDPEQHFDAAVAAGIDIGVSYLQQLERVAAASGTAFVHLKVDTGLGRNGAVEADWATLFERAVELEKAGRIVVRGLWSHLANSGDAEDAAQVEVFRTALAAARASGLTPELVHLAASGAALTLPDSHFSLVRCGLAAYGLSPLAGRTSASLGLRPAMRLSAAIVSVKRVPAGSGVSYGFDHRTTAASTLALVPLGYADGVPRRASGRGPVSINGVSYPVAGRVAMDQLVIDVGDAVVTVGDRAVLFGDPAEGVPSADDWAGAADTINYEVVTRIGARVQRRYVL